MTVGNSRERGAELSTPIILHRSPGGERQTSPGSHSCSEPRAQLFLQLNVALHIEDQSLLLNMECVLVPVSELTFLLIASHCAFLSQCPSPGPRCSRAPRWGESLVSGVTFQHKK